MNRWAEAKLRKRRRSRGTITVHRVKRSAFLAMLRGW